MLKDRNIEIVFHVIANFITWKYKQDNCLFRIKLCYKRGSKWYYKPGNKPELKWFRQVFSLVGTVLIVNEAVTDPEIIWALEVVLKKYSLNLCSDKKHIFQAMFKTVKLLRSLLVEAQSVFISLILALLRIFVRCFKMLWIMLLFMDFL